MEKSNNIDSSRNSFKDHTFYGRSRASPWSYGDHDLQVQDHDYLLGFSWPPRSYTCSFCKREFRSAQALGGHMNVHRRDRARLRLQQSSSSSSTPSPPYPNPNFSYSSMASPPPPPLTLFPTLSPPSSPCYKSGLVHSLSPKSKHSPENSCKTAKSSLVEAKALSKKDACKFLKKSDIISLELEIGLIQKSGQDLDLELRLGFA